MSTLSRPALYIPWSRPVNWQEAESLPVAVAPVPVRTLNALEMCGVTSVGELLRCCPRSQCRCGRVHLLSMPNVGPRSLVSLYCALATLGFNPPPKWLLSNLSWSSIQPEYCVSQLILTPEGDDPLIGKCLHEFEYGARCKSEFGQFVVRRCSICSSVRYIHYKGKNA